MNNIIKEIEIWKLPKNERKVIDNTLDFIKKRVESNKEEIIYMENKIKELKFSIKKDEEQLKKYL